MGLIEALILGVVQGATEFLPVSSTAHIRILPALLGWPDPGAAFTAVIQLGTLAAVISYFAGDLRRAFLAWLRSFVSREARESPEGQIGWAVLVGTIPIVIAGKMFETSIETSLRSLHIVAGALIGMGLLLWIAEITGKRKRSYASVRPLDGLWVGLWQAVALIPGASRSGSTITGALFTGFDRATAARFSFLLSIPAVFIAGAYSAYKHRELFQGPELAAIIVANIAAFVSGYAAIAFLMWLLQNRGTLGFVAYRVLLGMSILYLLQVGILSPLTGLSMAR